MEDIINNMKERKKEKLDKNDINLSLGEKPKREHKRRQLAPKNGLGILDDELKDENEFKKELDNDLIQRPQKERKKKSREGLKKKNESSLNTNSSSEDLAPKPKVTERVLSNKGINYLSPLFL
ncbi:hypothetical protein BCR36DRAFT_365396 [Piromyces finnis]|uniref:Uncharacterized protein n=1 Tax=Piromyces finnis TaxID=1754191 RepID=A0A1Y1VN18_9FUNG|nr:hypothetical protein BCR36DRAFT_365396 [Piromyces finnis]|eukprot:ORX60805.1 hypothetical protein BCR36DRAFT_365396 [Piromyces finnis]